MIYRENKFYLKELASFSIQISFFWLPLVLETASGIPLVNIAAPSAGGASRTDYECFKRNHEYKKAM